MMCRVKKTIGLALVAAGIAFAQGPQWENLYPEYSGLAFGGNNFVAVSLDGVIKTTSDGAAGLSQVFVRDNGWPNGKRIYAVAYGGGQFVAMQEGLTYLRSGNGVNWTPSAMNVVKRWRYIVSDGAETPRFVAVADDAGTVLISHDDVSSPPNPNADFLCHVAFGSEKFVVAGDGIHNSADVNGWGETSISGSVGVVAYGQDKFVALPKGGGSSVYTSSDGRIWITSPATGTVLPNMSDMVFGGGKFVAVGEKGTGCVSSDGIAWTQAAGLNPDDNFIAVKYGNNTFLALGAKGSVYKSTDGSSWTKQAGHSVGAYRQVVSDGSNVFVAVGDSGIAVSSNGGKSWDSKAIATGLTGVAYGAGKFVAVGNKGAIFSSPDGKEWTNHSGDAGETENFTSVAFGGSGADAAFIAGGWAPPPGTAGTNPTANSIGIIYTSANGTEWSGIAPNDMTGVGASGMYVAALCFGGGKFLAAVGTGGKLKHSSPGSYLGKFWSAVNLAEAEGYTIKSVTYANDRFIAVGAKGTDTAVILYSENVESGWAATSGLRGIRGVKSATYAKNTHIAVADSGNIYAYLNNTWILQPKATTRDLSAIYASGNAIVAAGAGRAILYSESQPVSVRYAANRRGAASPAAAAMSLERSRGAATVTLSFTPNKAGTISVYSLNGRQIYKARLGAGERSARLPERAMSSGSVVVKYSGDGGDRAVTQRFQIVR
jgi:hypothetical protein